MMPYRVSNQESETFRPLIRRWKPGFNIRKYYLCATSSFQVSGVHSIQAGEDTRFNGHQHHGIHLCNVKLQAGDAALISNVYVAMIVLLAHN